jgi:peptidylprolyl isomerase
VVQEGHSQPEITIPDTDAPEELVVEPLIQGEGAEVEEGQQVIVQYTGVRWEADENGGHEPFDSTWSRAGDPFDTTIGAGAVIEGWDQGMVGQNVGSRLLLVVPGDMAYGETEEEAMGGPVGTLVFVVDILGAVDNPPPAEETPEEGASAEEGAPEDEPSEGGSE